MENNKKLSIALTEFKAKYPSITSGDLQTFILGWNAAMNIGYVKCDHLEICKLRIDGKCKENCEFKFVK